MSGDYASGLAPYENKGVLGIPEIFDSDAVVEKKCIQLADLLRNSRHAVVHTGAGLSTSAKIPDFRGPNGIWTMQERNENPGMGVPFDLATPTFGHMALRALIESQHLKYIISQNIDGLHLRSGVPREYIAELHGNVFVEKCSKCRRQFVCNSASKTVGQKKSGRLCPATETAVDVGMRICRRGILYDTVLDWEHDLPENDLAMSEMHSSLADLNITLGTTLQVLPSGNLPLKNLKKGGKLVICNLQPTKHNAKAHLVINSYIDDVLAKVCDLLAVTVPAYSPDGDPVCSKRLLDWTLPGKQVQQLKKTVSTPKAKAESTN